MRAYKSLRVGARAPFTAFGWPRPDATGPGEWVEVAGDVAPCRNGVHACRVDQLPHWLGPELWVVELDGDIVETADHVVASRGRLVATVEAWLLGGAAAFSLACASRATELLEAERRHATADARAIATLAERVADAAAFARDGQAAVTAYVAAAVAGEIAGGSLRGPDFERGFLAERRWQASWLVERLGLERNDAVPGATVAAPPTGSTPRRAT